jgi:hypothetical protein
MFLRKSKKSDVKIINIWSEINEDFYAPGALVEVCQGKGVLREVYGEADRNTFSTLMFGNQPLFQLQGDEYYCPTCEKILRSGYGLEQSKEFRLDKLNEDKRQVSFEQLIQSIKSLLGLLSSDYYILLDTKLYPTNGNKHLFWEYPNENSSLPGTCIYYFKDECCTWGNLRPYFTVATQPVKKISKDRVEYYRNNPRGRAIAFYIDGYMTALLDGHHKAMAAALQHEMVDALVIIPCNNTKRLQGNGEYKNYVGFDSMIFDCDQYLLKQKKNVIGERVNEKQMKQILVNMPKDYINDLMPYNTDGLVNYYPSVDEVAYIDRVGNITEERLNDILSKDITCTEEEACELMKAMFGLRHRRIMEMAEFFLHRKYSGKAIFTIIQILTKLPRTEELELYLIDQMAQFEMEYPPIKKLVSDYL